VSTTSRASSSIGAPEGDEGSGCVMLSLRVPLSLRVLLLSLRVPLLSLRVPLVPLVPLGRAAVPLVPLVFSAGSRSSAVAVHSVPLSSTTRSVARRWRATRCRRP
jgi:hypothetical protein